MFNLDVLDSCKPLFIEHNILTIPSLYILETAMLVKSNVNLFHRLSDVVVRNRRDNNKVYIPNSKTAFMRKSVFRMAPCIYNKLPESVRNLSCSLFQKKLRTFLGKTAYYTIPEFMTDKNVLNIMKD